MLLVTGRRATGDTHEMAEAFFDDLIASRKAERAEGEAA
jgi:hypothetical protein